MSDIQTTTPEGGSNILEIAAGLRDRRPSEPKIDEFQLPEDTKRKTGVRGQDEGIDRKAGVKALEDWRPAKREKPATQDAALGLDGG